MDKRSIKKTIAGGLIAFMRDRRHWSYEVGPDEPVKESRTRIILRLISDEAGISYEALLGRIRGCWPLEMLGSYTDDELISRVAAAAGEVIMSQLDDELVAAEAKKAPAEAKKALAEAKKADDEVEIAVETTRLQLDELVTAEAKKTLAEAKKALAEAKKALAKLKSGETEAAVERAINELAAAKGETDWFGFSRSTWAGAATGVFVGIFLACGVLSTPAALAAVGFAGASALVLFSASFATVAFAAVLGGTIGAGMNWVHGWVERKSAKAAVTGAGAGMLVGSACIIAGSIYPPITIACLAAVGCAATPLTFALATGAVLVGCTAFFDIAGAALGYIYNHFYAESADNTPNALGN